MSRWTYFKIFLTSAVTCKQRFLHENEIVLYIQNCHGQDVKQGHLRKSVQDSTNSMKNDYPKTAHTF